MRHSRSQTAALIVASAAVGASCFVQPAPAERTGQGSAAIVGGQPDTSDVAVVAIKQTASGTLCSGTIVAPQVVLTAAHCVYQIQASDLEVLVGSTTSSPDQTLAVSGVVAYPTYDGETDGIPGGVDLGVIILAQPVSITPIGIDTAITSPELSSAQVTVVGYGLGTPGDVSTAGTRREISLPVESVCSRVLMAGTSGANACLGDSGGAVIAGGKLVAVVSGGSPDCNGPTTFTLASAHANWLASVLAGNPTAACPTCVEPDPSCGAATETAPARSEDAGEDAGAAEDAGPEGPIAPSKPAVHSGCAANGATAGEGAWGVVAVLVLAGAGRRRRRAARGDQARTRFEP